MSDKALKYLNTLNDNEQYPTARVDVRNKAVYMYRRSASSSVESMNSANKAARDRTAVDVVPSMKLLIDLETRRFHDKQEMVWNWTEELTPHEEMIGEAAARGHEVQSIIKTASEVMAMLETIVVKEEAERLKSSEGSVMTKAMKMEYKDEWLRINKDMLQHAGLGMPMI